MPNVPQTKTNPPFPFRPIGWAVLCLAAVLLIVGGVLRLVYQPMAVEAARTALPQAFAAKVDYGAVELSFFDDFPRISAQISNIRLQFNAARQKELGLTTPVFFQAEQAAFSFAPLDLLSGVYTLKAIRLKAPDFVLQTDSAGRFSWQNWLKKGWRKKKTAYDLSTLEKRTITDGRAYYQDIRNGRYAELNGLNGTLVGLLLQDQSEVSVKLSGETLLRQGERVWAKGKHVSLEAKIGVDRYLNQWEVVNLLLNYDELTLKLFGLINFHAPEPYFDLNFSFPDFNLKRALTLIPAIHSKMLIGWKSDGSAALTGAVKGVFSETQSPVLLANLQLKGAGLHNGKIAVADVLNGEVELVYHPDDPAHSFIEAKEIKGRMGGQLFVFQYRQLLAQAYLTMKTTGAFDLAALEPLLQTQHPALKISGKMSFDFSAQAHLDRIRQGDWTHSDWQGMAEATDFRLSPDPNSAQKFDFANFSIHFKQSECRLETILLHAGASDLAFKAVCKETAEYWFGQTDKLLFEGQIDAGRLYDSDFIVKAEADSQAFPLRRLAPVGSDFTLRLRAREFTLLAESGRNLYAKVWFNADSAAILSGGFFRDGKRYGFWQNAVAQDTAYVPPTDSAATDTSMRR